MRAVLAERFPEHGILGEEFGLERPHARLRWVLDPIDGTRAFITGRPMFGTLIALLDGDRSILGVIDQPVTGERWIGAAGMRDPLPRAATAAASAAGPAPRWTRPKSPAPAPRCSADDLPRWQRLCGAARRVTYGGDCYAYGLLALGQIDVIAEAGLKIWDWAALCRWSKARAADSPTGPAQPMRPDGDGRALAVGDPAPCLRRPSRLLGRPVPSPT